MKETPKTLAILGRQPQLGLAELESLYGDGVIKDLDGAALLGIPAEDIDFGRLGGTVKVGKILNILTYTEWPRLLSYLKSEVPKHLKYLPPGSFTIGLSTYGIKVSPSQINKSMLEIKKIIKASGRSVRIVPNKSNELNSAQVLHNKLTHKGGWELLFYQHGSKTYLAQAFFVQDIEAYARRDQARPARDARVGMLPPKLAQILINLATGKIDQPKAESRKPKALRILDPFCGTGVILQEALLMGYHVYGTDIEPRMVEYSKQNLEWLLKRYSELEGHAAIDLADATDHKWPAFSTVASETYLGRPLNQLPSEANLKKIINDVNTIIKKFLINLQPQLRENALVCLAVPAWRMPDGTFNHLPVIDHLTDMGYNRLSFKHLRSDKLIYFRENQIVARQILVMKRNK